MPATNYTPIQLYRSTTSGNLPLAANLSPGELALNIADNDMTMYMENASGVVKSFFNNPAALKYPTADGTSGQFLTTNGAGVLSFGSVAAGALTNNTRQAVTSSATTTLNLNSGNVIDLTMAASIATLSFTNVPASGTPILIQIVVKNASDGTAYTIAWPNSVYWSGQYAATTPSTVQTAPTLATGANGVTVIALLTTDGGTKWRGWVEATIPGGAQNSLYAMGWDSNGQVGNNTQGVNRSSPVQIGSLTNWAVVSGGGEFAAAINTAGQLFTWGIVSDGRLGLGDNSFNRSFPTQVGVETGWTAVALGDSHAIGIRNSVIYAWGLNTDGQCARPTTIAAISSPVAISSGWASVSCGDTSSYAISLTGTMFAWGLNSSGNLGVNDTVNRSSPTQIGNSTTWTSVVGFTAGALAIESGKLYSWGNGQQGRLGQNDTVNRSSPKQIGALTNWRSIVSGSKTTSNGAINTSNELYMWGLNQYGGVGDNTAITKSSPVQIGSGVWSVGWSCNQSAMAVQTDGSLWSWGENSTGTGGRNNATNSSSPAQVGALTGWAGIGAGGTLTNYVLYRAATVSPA